MYAGALVLIFSIGFTDIFLDDCFILLFAFEREDDLVFLLTNAFEAIFLLTAFFLGCFFGFLTIAFFLGAIS